MQSPACFHCSARTGSTVSCLTGRGAGAGVAEVRGAGVDRVAVGVEEEIGAVGLETMAVDDDPTGRLDFCLEDDEDDDAGFEWW